jgi:hypothetical protein
MDTLVFIKVAITQAILPYFKRITVVVSLWLAVSLDLLVSLRSGYAASKHAIKGYFETYNVNCLNQYYHFCISGRINTNILKKFLWAMDSNGATDENNEVGMDVTVCVKKL